MCALNVLEPFPKVKSSATLAVLVKNADSLIYLIQISVGALGLCILNTPQGD